LLIHWAPFLRGYRAGKHLLIYPTRRGKIINNLLAYCRLDTLAMVKILESLRKNMLDG